MIEPGEREHYLEPNTASGGLQVERRKLLHNCSERALRPFVFTRYARRRLRGCEKHILFPVKNAL